MTDQNDQEKAKENEKTASLAGAGAGVVAGAQIGTVLLPIPIVGTFTGALVGGLIGSKIGKRVGGVLLDKMSMDKSGNAQAAKADMSAELQRLAQLRDQGVLDEQEFKAAKAKLLGL